ncbi:MAG: pseudouridine-5'-phosphate glycosidase [Gemmatimonadetes bacterium]|nr:pseudouridine-5'-phosphate glycosidase [Gemmatimonadota bacterium]
MIRISDEVKHALSSGQPVVALESTLLAHGLPHPRNLEVGRALEADVWAGGAVPATIAVLGGRPTVGLTADEMERIATRSGALKLSTRDLPIAVAEGRDGATTVAATMWLAARAGVRVFATGGIGGVHRGEPRDVSADLTELGRTPMVVVCAGAKAILDLPATREALETYGVLVAGWETDELPAFYSIGSGLGVDVRVEDAAAAAALWRSHRALESPGAILLCVPPPAELALPTAEVEAQIASALRRAAAEGIRGKEITPFLLREVARLTGGRSLEANVGLLRNNVAIAARVAVALSER